MNRLQAGLEESAELIEVFSDTTIRVARTGHLIALKLLSTDREKRPQDEMDLLTLFAAADSAELDRARMAAALIEQREYNRGRDLRVDLERRTRPDG